MSDAGAGDHDETYEIRPYRPGDASDVATLYDSVWGTDVDADWLDYRFVQNPFVDRTTLLVADAGESVVGARPYVAFPIRANGRTDIGLMLVSLMVHPDHRRRGLFTRMTERTVEQHADDATITVNFANELSAPGYHKMWFTEIGTGPHKDGRLHRPSAHVDEVVAVPFQWVAGVTADAATSVYNRGIAALQSPPDLDVERTRGIPASRLASIAERPDVDTIHTDRTPDLYRWLAADSRWHYRSYIATGPGEDIAAPVVAERTGPQAGGWIVDAVPLGDTARDALEGLLAAVVRAYRDAPHLVVSGPVVNEHVLSAALLRRYGFLPTTNPLLERVTPGPDTVFVHYFGDSPPTFGGLDVRDPENWQARIQ